MSCTRWPATISNLTEDHNHYIDQVGNGIMRLPILELGRRMIKKAIEDEKDVFMLYLAEMRAGLGGTDQQAVVDERSTEMRRSSKVVPVPAIGEPPPPNDDPMGAAITKMFGVPPEPSPAPHGAREGQGRSHSVRGQQVPAARRAGVPDDHASVNASILHREGRCRRHRGGVLSHCAIVYREYRLPGAVGSIVGTSVIQNGILLTVDGSNGLLRIDSRS